MRRPPPRKKFRANRSNRRFRHPAAIGKVPAEIFTLGGASEKASKIVQVAYNTTTNSRRFAPKSTLHSVPFRCAVAAGPRTCPLALGAESGWRLAALAAPPLKPAASRCCSVHSKRGCASRASDNGASHITVCGVWNSSVYRSRLGHGGVPGALALDPVVHSWPHPVLPPSSFAPLATRGALATSGASRAAAMASTYMVRGGEGEG